MPVEVVGFHLKPCSFFTANPALDLPPEVNKASKLAVAPSADAPGAWGVGAAAALGGGCCGHLAVQSAAGKEVGEGVADGAAVTGAPAARPIVSKL